MMCDNFKIRSVILLLSTLFVCSCQFEPGPIGFRDVPCGTLQQVQQQILEDTPGNDESVFAESDTWIFEDWWTLFKDPQLESLIDMSLAQNPSLLAAEARIDVSLAQRRLARSALFPTLEGDGDSMQVHNSKNGIFGLAPQFPLTYRQTEMFLSFGYEFDFWRKHYNEAAIASNHVLMSGAEAYLARLVLATSVADAYFQRQIAAQRTEVASRLVHNLQEAASLTKLRKEHALDSEINVNKALGAVHTAKQYERSVLLNLATSNNALQALLADDFSVTVECADMEIGIADPFPLPVLLPIDLLAHRADVWIQRWRAEAAARQISVAKADFYPNINLTGFIGLQTIHKHLFQSKSLYGSYGPAIHLPIFEGGALLAAYDTSKAEFIVAIAEYESTVLDAVKDVLNALAIVKTTSEQYQDALAIESVALANWKLAKRRFKQQINSRLEVLSAEYDWLQASNSRYQILLDSLQARLLLIRALGGGFYIPCEDRTETNDCNT